MSAEPEPAAAHSLRPPGTRAGSPLPLGAHPDAQGVSFSVYAPDATTLALALYERAESIAPVALLTLDPQLHRTGHYWHVYVEGLSAGAWYTWRVDRQELLDPCAREVSMALWNRAPASGGDAGSMRARVVVESDYDWEGDAPLGLPHERAIIYELHVGGFTRHASAGVDRPGTYAALIEKIPYLKALGVTHVELMPVMAFDAQDVPAGTAALGLHNYWGYSPCAFYAPHPGYAGVPDATRRELRDLVKALHRAGLGVILDVVLNHTAEGGADGPVLHFKSLARRSAYHVDSRGAFLNYSGCGNTINCNHPATGRLLLECAEYWVREMHVDGLRFDLASASRGETASRVTTLGSRARSILTRLAQTRLIAEPWDAGVSGRPLSAPSLRRMFWRYRDVVRASCAASRLVGEVAHCIAGSSDLYELAGGRPRTASTSSPVTTDSRWDLVS
jgi:glycogen operon protein